LPDGEPGVVELEQLATSPTAMTTVTIPTSAFFMGTNSFKPE